VLHIQKVVVKYGVSMKRVIIINDLKLLCCQYAMKFSWAISYVSMELISSNSENDEQYGL
jgi:hypothetical protein